MLIPKQGVCYHTARRPGSYTVTVPKIGDILMRTTDGQELVLRRVARPEPEQARILEALKLTMPERLITPDRIL